MKKSLQKDILAGRFFVERGKGIAKVTENINGHKDDFISSMKKAPP